LIGGVVTGVDEIEFTGKLGTGADVGDLIGGVVTGVDETDFTGKLGTGADGDLILWLRSGALSDVGDA
jgi:hypothetical protein